MNTEKLIYANRQHLDSQYVTDDAYAPHVGGITDGFIVDHLRSHKLWSPEQNLQSSSIFCQKTTEPIKEPIYTIWI